MQVFTMDQPDPVSSWEQRDLGAPRLSDQLGLQVTSFFWAQGAAFSVPETGVGTTWKGQQTGLKQLVQQFAQGV